MTKPRSVKTGVCLVEPPRIEQVLIKYLFRRLFYSNSKKCCLIVTNYPYKRAVDHPQGTGKPALL